MTVIEPQAAEQLGHTLRQWRVAADMRLEDVSAAVSAALPRSYRISRETVRRYESGAVQFRLMDPVTVLGIALVTGHSLGELPDKMKEDFMRIAEMAQDPRISSLLDSPA